MCQEHGDRPSVMWVSKETLKPNSGKNIKEKLSGKPASILNTMITLEEFEAYEA